jgi:hypothetical protein
VTPFRRTQRTQTAKEEAFAVEAGLWLA